MAQQKEEKKYDFLFKVVMIGDHGVGKTQLIVRYTKDDFDMHSKTTLGVEFTTHSATIESKSIGAQLWDTAGEEKYKSLTSIYYKGAVGAMLVYDITRKETFERISAQWLNELKSFSDPNIVIILIGNKCDLKEKREVTTEEAASFAEKNGIREN
jgi:Ras-related protein Rab-11A